MRKTCTKIGFVAGVVITWGYYLVHPEVFSVCANVSDKSYHTICLSSMVIGMLFATLVNIVMFCVLGLFIDIVRNWFSKPNPNLRNWA